MNISKAISGPHFFPITCTREDFKSLILSEIEQSGNHFSSQNLIDNIRSKCDFQKEPNVIYTGKIDFLGTDLDFINRIIWEQIWDRKLMIDLTNRKDSFGQTDKIQFIKVI